MNNQYPISEIFTSPQGEGVWTGTMMTFIRLAGCTVGKPYPKECYDHRLSHIPLPIYTEKCTLYDGRTFECDTDYRKKKMLGVDQILGEVTGKSVCITGGEPLMHDISPLLYALRENHKDIHLETSGTISSVDLLNVWVTLSPKVNPLKEMILRANEFKILVDSDFNPEIPLLDDIAFYDIRSIAKNTPVYLQPINYENEVNRDNVRLCMKWQEKYPQFRISLQLHKVLSLYTEEKVR